MLEFNYLELRRENIYNQSTLNSVAPLEITGSSLRANARFSTKLGEFHQIDVILSLDEMNEIIKICDKAALRTAGAIFAASQEENPSQRPPLV